MFEALKDLEFVTRESQGGVMLKKGMTSIEAAHNSELIWLIVPLISDRCNQIMEGQNSSRQELQYKTACYESDDNPDSSLDNFDLTLAQDLILILE